LPESRWSAALTKVGQAFTHPVARRQEQKFTPADPTVHWQYINHLVYTAGTTLPQHAQGDYNSAVFACLRALANASIEAPLRVYQKTDAGELEPVENSPIQDLLDEPHPELDMLEIRWWLAWARHADGNAYLLKVRNGVGAVIELWPVSPLVMSPHTERGSNNFIDWYEMDRSDGRGKQQIPVEDVMHFKVGVDPLDVRKGIAPLKRLLREIASDAEATKYQDAILRNFGIPGLVASLPAETMLSPKQLEEIKHDLERKFGGENRGSVAVMTGGAKMEQFGFSPQQMTLEALHDVPETRIAAVMGVPPAVAGLGVGLDQTTNFASLRQVSENFIEVTIAPIWKLDESKWTRKLAREFSSDKRIQIKHDLGEVRSLQEDENAKADRISKLFSTGVITREIALTELGYDPELPGEDILFVPTSGQYVTVDQATTDVEEQRQQELDAQAAEADARAQALAANKPAAGGPPGSKESSDELLARALQQLVDVSANQMEDDLVALQASQQRRVKKALLSGKFQG